MNKAYNTNDNELIFEAFMKSKIPASVELNSLIKLFNVFKTGGVYSSPENKNVKVRPENPQEKEWGDEARIFLSQLAQGKAPKGSFALNPVHAWCFWFYNDDDDVPDQIPITNNGKVIYKVDNDL